MQIEPLESAARRFLENDFLSERAVRVVELAYWVADFAELRAAACSRRAVQAAAWFQDAWCVEEVRGGRFAAPLVLAQQPMEGQRRRAAEAADGQLRGLLDDATLDLAVRAIREAGSRATVLTEAVVLAEAVNLDSIGPLWLCGQVARCAAAERPFGTVVGLCERHVDYGYWRRRIEETLRFARSRELARQRVAALDACMIALRDQLSGGDRHTAPVREG